MHLFSIHPSYEWHNYDFPHKKSDLCPKLWSVHIDKFFARAVIIYHEDIHNLCAALLAESKIRLDLHRWKCSSLHIFCVKRQSHLNKLGSLNLHIPREKRQNSTSFERLPLIFYWISRYLTWHNSFAAIFSFETINVFIYLTFTYAIVNPYNSNKRQ